MFEHQRFNPEAIWSVVRNTVVSRLPDNVPVVAVLDDTLVRKWGRKVKGAGYKRDPLGPKFRANFIWAQRFLQVSLIAPEFGLHSRGRAIPVDLLHAPTPKKPGRKADENAWRQYKQECNACRITVRGAERVVALRQSMNANALTKDRPLVVAVDGGYTNREMLRAIPENTCIIGRIRKDAKLFAPPDASEAGTRGRRRCYGSQLPTPERIRQDEDIPWRNVTAYASGQCHDFDVKTIDCVRWKASGPKDMRLIIMRPLAYRPKKGAKLLYRDPAYLICSDPTMPLEQVIQAYLWRWETEVAFREQKSIMGMGDAQVTSAKAVEAAPVFIAATYAMLHAAALKAGITSSGIARPKWRRDTPSTRCTTTQLIARLRAELWGRALGINFNDFAQKQDLARSPRNSPSQLASAVLNGFL